ncbi:MAG: alpha-hydroxy-acid oxidizing protein [Actinobacteria bacterium]|nr:alpha-hydroxy-acid oxidizing protein [Actinomycetota bacterium]
MVERRLPRPNEILPLIGRRDRSLTRLQARLERCASIGDLRDLAKRRVPKPDFDYTDGAAGSELTLRRSVEAYSRVEFTPRVLRDVSSVDLSVEMLGKRSALPFAFGPTGFTRMMHHVGEPAVAKVAGESGIPYALSTLGTTSVEALAQVSPDTRRWFQLYVWRDRVASEALVKRVELAGYDTLILTVDTAVGGIRLRDVRNGLTIPPQLSLGTLAGMALYPRWWGNLLTTRPLEFASLSSTGGTVGDLLTKVFDPSITGADIAWLRSIWPGRLVLKGVQSVEDAVIAVDLGVDAVILSNHGGRQIDRGNVPLEILPKVVDSVGDRIEVYVDGGITCGADIVAALAFGATGALIGRGYLYGLMAGGEDGVRRVVSILEKEIKTTMQLLGVTSVGELDRSYVRLR